MNAVRLIVLGVGLAGFLVAFFAQFRVRYHVSPQRVQELLDTPSRLYHFGTTPPRRVLDERGRRVQGVMIAGTALFVGSMLVMFLLEISAG